MGERWSRRFAAGATTGLRAAASALDDQRSRRSHIVMQTPDGREGFALFGGFRARHRLAARYLPAAEELRTRLAFHPPTTVELCRDLVARWGLVAFCGDSAPPVLASEMLTVPVEVDMEMPTPCAFEGPDALWTRSAKSNISKVKRGKFSFDIVNPDQWVTEFQRRMHRPSMRNRHRAKAYVVSRRVMAQRARAQGAELLRVFQDGRWVAGCLNQSTPAGYRLLNAGWQDGDAALPKTGAMSAIYWFSFHRAAALGHRRILLGSVEPYLDDGIFVYKANWGAALSTDSRWSGKFRLLLEPSHPTCSRFLRSHAIVTTGTDGYYIVLSGHPPDAVDVSPEVLSGVKRWYVWRDRPLAVPEVTSDDVPGPLRPWISAAIG